MLFIRLALIFSYNLDADGAEFTFVHYIQKLMDGKELYLNPESYPYTTVLYAPLYLYVVFIITKLLQLDFLNNIHEIYVAGRCVSFICVLGCLYIVDLIIRRHTSGITMRLTGIFVFLNIISGHAFAMRPDSMKILFFLAFIYQYFNFFFYDRNIRNGLLYLLFFVLSFISKQDVIVYIVLIHAVHFIIARTKQSFMALTLSVALFLLLSFSLKLLFGKFVFINLFSFNLQSISNISSSYNLLVVIFNILRFSPVLLFLIYSLRLLKVKKETELNVVILSSLFSFAATTFFLFRPGSYLNYTYESSILIMYGLFLLLVKHNFRNKILIATYFLLLFISNIFIKKFKNYRYYPLVENNYKIEYKKISALRMHFLPLFKDNSCLFTPHLQLGIFFADQNIIYGHEFHLDRHIYALLGIRTSSKLLLNSSVKYDEEFLNGNVKYILTLDKKEVNETIRLFYKKYKLKEKFKSALLYEYKE